MRKNVVIGIIITVMLVMSSQVLAAESNQGGWSMDSIEIKSVPAEYRRAVPREQRGKLREVTYEVHNYINASRQLVTNQDLAQPAGGWDATPDLVERESAAESALHRPSRRTGRATRQPNPRRPPASGGPAYFRHGWRR